MTLQGNSPSCRQFNIQSRRGIIRQPDDPREPIQTVPDRDIQRLAEYPITLLRIGDHLGVSARDVEDDGVVGLGDVAAHFDVCVGVWVSVVMMGLGGRGAYGRRSG